MHRILALLPLFAGCAPEPPQPPETDLRPAWDGEWPAAFDSRLLLSDGALVLELAGPDDGSEEAQVLLAAEAVGVPALSADGRRLVLSRRGNGPGITVLDVVSVLQHGVEQRTLVDVGTPDRAAISEDGTRVAWVSGASGIASVWTAPFDGGTPEQLTNRALVRTPGQAPPGFVPPPHAGPLRIVGDRVVWTTPEGPQGVALP